MSVEMTAKSEKRDLASRPGERPARLYPDPQADTRCVAAVLAGDRQRFGELVERYQNAVFSLIYGYLKETHTAEDVAQEVFIDAFKALGSLRQPELFFPWLLQIARHRATNVSRRAGRTPEQQPLTGLERETLADPGRDEKLHRAFSALEELPEPYRHTLLLRYEGRLSCKEIAELEKVAVGTITCRLTRGLMLLRTALRENR
jgi:RNA polymerase sigma-70 factor (ECF subfamily)